MSATIGIRAYQITVHRKGERASLPFDSDELSDPPLDFLKKFVAGHVNPLANAALERSWYFEEKKRTPTGSKGYVHYGTFGFESNFVDSKTKKKNYRRQVTDVEEIPLFYEFWFPEREDFALAVFQSFQGRSCIQMVSALLKSAFEKRNPNFRIQFSKLMPNDLKGSAYYSAPVKRFRLIKRQASSDLADQYLGGSNGDPIDFEIVINARRNRNLGPLGEVKTRLNKKAAGLITHGGVEFSEAIAEVKFGNRLRRVGVFGLNSDAGVIDITEDIVKGADGHPTFQSLMKQTDELLDDFYDALSG